MALPHRDQRHQYLRYEGLQYTEGDIADYETRDHMLRFFHRLIACSIVGRSQAPKKVTVIDLFYLRGMDVDSVNVPYLLARLLTKERLRGLTVIVRELFVIDMAELVRLQLCIKLDDTWAWVASGPERQPDAATGTPEAAEDAPIADEGASAVPTPIRGALGEQREILDSMARDFSQFFTWTVVGLSQMMSHTGVRYTSYADFQMPYERRTKRRTDDASTSTAQQDEQQPDL
ncbi:hypothetical protein Tco_1089535, partial [Tanacetum coccineum]